jgi:hypothetical protein
MRKNPALSPSGQDGALIGRDTGGWNGVIWHAPIIFSPALNVQPISAVRH